MYVGMLKSRTVEDAMVQKFGLMQEYNRQYLSDARKALEQWRFRPGTKDGQPVDVEAVVRVPFKVPRREF